MKNVANFAFALLTVSITFSFFCRQSASQPFTAVKIEGKLLDKAGKPVKDKVKVYIFENRKPQKGERCIRHTYTSLQNPGRFSFIATGQTTKSQAILRERVLGFEEDVNLNFSLVFERYLDNSKQPTGKDTIYYWPSFSYNKPISAIVEADNTVKTPISIECRLPE